MEHDIPFGNSNRENGTTFLDFPLFLGIFQWDEPTKRVPFTAEPEIPEILTKGKAPLVPPSSLLLSPSPNVQKAVLPPEEHGPRTMKDIREVLKASCLRQIVPRDQLCRLRLIISTQKLVGLRNFLSTRIVLSCYYLLIFNFENLSS